MGSVSVVGVSESVLVVSYSVIGLSDSGVGG